MAAADVLIIEAFVITAVIVVVALGLLYDRFSRRPRPRRPAPPPPQESDDSGGSDGGGCADGGE